MSATYVTSKVDRIAFNSIPLINISGLYSEKYDDREAAVSAIAYAARNVGFFIIEGHHVSPDITERLLRASEDFFSKTEDYKRQFYIGTNGYHNGYVPMDEEGYGSKVPDYKEAFNANEDFEPNEDFVLNQKYPLVGPVNWPDLPGFRDDINSYFQEVQKLGKYLWGAFSLGLGLTEDVFRKETDRPPCFLRMIRYPPNNENDDAVGLSAHTDYEAFTILLTMQEGLEVMNENGEWIDVPQIPGTFIVNIGDMLESMTAGQFVATTHRVRKVKEERYSFPFFFSCDHDTPVKPLPQIATDDKMYLTTTFGTHLWAGLVNTYSYLSREVEAGRLPRPEKELVTFGYVK